MTAALCILGGAICSSLLVLFGQPADRVIDSFVNHSLGILCHAVAIRFSK